MAMGGKDRPPGVFTLGAKGASPIMPVPGSTEHALFVLVILELAALIFLRRYMRSAHGG